MDNYFERLEEIVRGHEQEIDHLNAERMALRQEEGNMSFDAFNKEYQRIIYHLENETRSLNAAQDTLDSYHYNYDKSRSLILDLRNLRNELDQARDRQDETEIKEEINRKEEELSSSISLLPLELADYLRNSIVDGEKTEEKQSTPEENEVVPENVISEENEVASETVISEENEVAPETVISEENEVAPETVISEENEVAPETVISEENEIVIENNMLSTDETPEDKPLFEIQNPVEEDNLSETQQISPDTRVEVESTSNDAVATQEDIKSSLSPEALANYENLSQQIESVKSEQLENDRLLEETINRIQEIFKEEREKFENDGPFDTENLNRLQEYYMGLKISENEVFVELQRNKARLNRRIKTLERKQREVTEIDNISMAFEISYKESEELFKTLNNKKIINEIYERKGLGEIIHKKSRTKIEKEILKKALEETRAEIINYQKNNKETNISAAINVLYGMDEKVNKSSKKDKEIALPIKNVESLKNNTKQLPAVIRKSNFKEPSKNKPLEAPKDIPIPKNEQLLLPDKQEKIFALPDKQGQNLALPDKRGQNLALPDKQGKLPALPLLKDDNKDKEKANKNIQPKPEPKPVPKLEPKPEPAPKPVKPQKDDKIPQQNTEKPKLKRGLREIIGTLRQGLEIGKKDGQRYRRSNLKVSQNFRNELHSGNVLYNIVHVVPATIKAGVELLGKISGKIMLGKDAKEMMHVLEQRIDELPAEDLETIYKEYRGNRVNQERYPQALNMVIENKMSEYILGKVTVINNNIEKSYTEVIYLQNLLKSIDDNLRKGKISSEDKLKKLEQRKGILEKAASNIKYIRNAKIEADNLLSGGLHGLSEDIKASASKLNCIGMRFTKTHDIDNTLEDALMDCEKRENKAIYEGNDEELLKAFIESEVLLSKNTQIDNSIFGRRSTGKKYYSPLAEQLDYRNDPFIRDLFTTIAVTTAALSATTALKNQSNASDGVFKTKDDLLEKVHKAGEDITSKRGAMYEGMKAQANQDVLTGAGTVERATLDTNGWAIGTDAYHAADHAGHEFYSGFYNDVQAKIADVTRNYNGVGGQTEVLQGLSQIANDSHATLVNVASKCLEILKPYAKNNPQFDLGAFQSTMEFLVSHPNAIANMNQAMVDVQNIGEELITLSESQMSMLNSLPNNLGTTILSAASACALAANVSNTMGAKRKEYGNNVTDMIEEYAETREAEDYRKTI